MMFYRKILVLLLAVLLAACSGAQKPSTPLDTLQAYVVAIKKKDTTTMKVLLSDATIKMHQQSAKEQGVTLDEIVERETLFTSDQKRAEYRNEIVEGDKASIEMKNSYGVWDKISFVKEDGVWKIDKQAFANPILEQNELKNQQLDEMINQGKQP
jgi:hypothetical protein